MNRSACPASVTQEFLELTENGGELGRLMRSVDWSQSPVGPFERWPQSLKTALSICLGSRFPMLVWWGRDLTVFYNDAYIPFAAPAKHPQFLGRPAREQWAEIWNMLGPLTEQVFETGKATWAESMQLFMTRKGFLEETYFTFSYSPVRDETGAVGGIINPCQETTERILGERRLKTLHELGSEKITKLSDLGTTASRVLINNPHDVPFALIYLSNPTEKSASLVGASGIAAGTLAAPETIDLTTQSRWPIASVNQSKKPERIDGLRSRFLKDLPQAPYEERPDSALILPIELAGKEEPVGFLILGISSRLAFDDRYREFFGLVGKHLSTHLSNIRLIEEETKRAEALAEIDQAKTVFFSNVSHEFRTPLTLMLGPLEDLLSGTRGPIPTALRPDVELLHRNARRLLKLVNTLLEFSRIEAGRIQASYEPTDFSMLTADFASAFRSAVERAGVRLVVDCPRFSEPVYVDRDMWEKIVLNLVSNAFKFTLKGEIKIQTVQRRTHVELLVADTGAGIPEHEIPRLFERFHRVEGTVGRSFEGTGIGLALVKELVRLHGGTISVRSELGKGTTFAVSIPLGTGHVSPQQIKETQTAGTFRGAAPFVEEAVRWISTPSELPAKADRHNENFVEKLPSAARILLADDNADMCDYMKRLLSDHWQVETVSDGFDLLKRAKEWVPDLIITDVMMPNLSGFEAIHELKGSPATKDIPVIMISARAGEEARVEGFQTGADDYLTKPFSAKELIARTRAILAKTRLTVESLRNKNIELARANAELERFAWLSSHDLREPIRIIKLYTDVLVEQLGSVVTKESRDVLSILSDGASRMDILIEGLRTYAVSRSHDVTEAKVDCNLVVRDVLANLKLSLDQAQAAIQSDPLPFVKGNFAGLLLVFQNLISNSLKFKTDRSPLIKINVRKGEGDWLFSVQDNGLGFDSKYSDRIFLMGSRLHGASVHPGAGMGLAICKSIVERHGGHIWAESQLGKGATFYFTLSDGASVGATKPLSSVKGHS